MNERTKWFNEARFGMFIHLGLYSILSYQEWCRTRDRISDREYQGLLKRFNPDRYNPEKWAALAKRAGMKYSVFTAKHHDGFCLFDSKYTDFKVTNAQVKQDMIKGYLTAFRNCDLEAGLYYSLLDWNHPEYTIDRIHPHRNHPDWNLPLGENPEPHRDMAKYREYMFNQIEELLTNYGKIPLMWFDFSFDEKGPDDWDSESLSRLIRSRQPDIVLNSRLDRGHLIGKKTKYSGDGRKPFTERRSDIARGYSRRSNKNPRGCGGLDEFAQQ
ncbi:MAG: alpha-L-fucosidase [Lentisphaerae bacterium]|nr:alpha-L-fucosidase [Lentisphaerota bacterium]